MTQNSSGNQLSAFREDSQSHFGFPITPIGVLAPRVAQTSQNLVVHVFVKSTKNSSSELLKSKSCEPRGFTYHPLAIKFHVHNKIFPLLYLGKYQQCVDTIPLVIMKEYTPVLSSQLSLKKSVNVLYSLENITAIVSIVKKQLFWGLS